MTQLFEARLYASKLFQPKLLAGAIHDIGSDARSGYWRLFFTNLQEEALRVDTQTSKVSAAPPANAGATVSKPKRKKVVKPVRGQEPKVEDEPLIQSVPLRLSPVRALPTLQDAIKTLVPLPASTAFSHKVYQQSATVHSFAAARKKREQQRRRAAAFLLLAA